MVFDPVSYSFSVTPDVLKIPRSEAVAHLIEDGDDLCNGDDDDDDDNEEEDDD